MSPFHPKTHAYRPEMVIIVMFMHVLLFIIFMKKIGVPYKKRKNTGYAEARMSE
jgi:hypothetical protein